MALQRKHFNLVIDLVAFVGLVGLVVTGFILHFSLPPGSGGRPGSGGEHEGRAYLSLWGLTRHEWGDIHFWIAVALMSVVALHLILHWRWIVSMVRGRASDASGLRAGLGLVGLATIVFLALSPFLSPVESQSEDLPEAAPSHEAREPAPGDGLRGSGSARWDPQGHIDWSLTCAELAEELGVSVAELLDALGVPPGVSSSLTLDDLRAQYGVRGWQIRDAAGELAAPQ